ncbi:ATP-binding protein [Kitasatospora sp. NPDC094011]|uniref:ATP-binding protein n=1 Tax=Kitasatospora sp. NPDC094011 TaxID=3364090 RepID=UPI0038290988
MLVGRERELSRLVALVRADERRPTVAVLEGPPGIGKTRLLAELRRSAAGLGRPIGQARATPDTRPAPYGLLLDACWATGARDLLERLADEADAPDGTGPRSGHVAGADHRLRHHRRLRERLAGESLVLLLDDLQWADHQSLLLLDRLIAHPPAGRFTVVLACRRGGCPPWLARSLTDEGALWTELAPLAPPDVSALLPAAAPAHRPLLAAASGGNPRYLRALADLPADLVAVLAAGDPRLTEGPAGHAPAGGWQPGPELCGELATLSEHGREVLRAAAVAGPEFDLALVAAVAGLPAEVVGAAVDELVGHGCVAGADGRYRFAQPVVGAAAYRSVGPVWRSEAHRRAADHLAGRGASPVQPAGPAGNVGPASLAEWLPGRPHRSDRPDRPGRPDRPYLTARTARADGPPARSGGRSAADPDDELRRARTDLMNGRTELCLRRVDAVLHGGCPDRTLVAAHGLTSLAAIGQGAVRGGRRALDAAERLADTLDERGRLAALDILPELGWAGVLLERGQHTAERVARGVALAERHRRHEVIGQLRAVQAALLLLSGPLEDAIRAADEAIELATEAGSTETVATATALRLRAVLWKSGPDAAGPALARLRTLPEPPTAVWRAVVRHAAVEVAVACGQRLTAAEATRMLSLGDDRWRDPMPAHGHDLVAAVHAAEGNLDQLARHVGLVGRAARNAGLPAAGAVVPLASARLSRARGEYDRASTLARLAGDRLAASGFLVRAGLAQLLAADICADHGDRSGYRGATGEARRLFERVGAHALFARAEQPWRRGRSGPAVPGGGAADGPTGPTVGPRPPLSPREAEVADLVAQGLTNQAIAQRLFLSVRTVEAHLTVVYRKLGISGRGAVARALDAARPGGAVRPAAHRGFPPFVPPFVRPSVTG